VLAWLYANEINCGLESFWDRGWTVYLGDEINGQRWVYVAESLEEAAAALYEAALIMYPATPKLFDA
jgi:hypothetical protein